MKCLVMHDGAGNIAAIVTCPSESPAVIVTPQPGLLMSEVEVPEGTIDLTSPESEKRVAEVLAQFQIRGRSEGKLVKRTSAETKR